MTEIFEYVFPGLMLMWGCFIANGVFVDIFDEYRANTMARLLGSGVGVWEVMLSKIIRCVAVCWICELLLIVFTWMVFDVGWRDPVMLFVVLTTFNLLLTGFLALVYGYARSVDLANAIIVLFLMLSSVLGGSLVPFRELPRALQTLGRWSIIRMANSGIESIFGSKGAWEALRPSLMMAAAGIVLTALGLAVMRRRFELGQVK
jgi:ABC-type multidrug transport system permease subunit